MASPLPDSARWRRATLAKPLPAELEHVSQLATVGALTGATAHQIGSPLNVAMGRAQLILSGLLSPEEVQQNASIILTELRRVAAALRPLAEYAGGPSNTQTVVQLDELARKAAALVAPFAHKRGVQIVAGGESVAAVGQTGALMHVLVCLTLNATQAQIEAGGGGVQLTVASRRMTSPAGEPQDCVCVDVCDAGAGIGEGDASRIFDAFYTTRNGLEGMGLGLPVAAAIAREHGGWIGVSSQLGHGSCFTLCLPKLH